MRVQRDRARGVSANLEDAVRLTRFAHEFAAAFREVRPFDPVELLSHLHEHRVEHIIVGGLAISAHGYVHAVEQVDVVAEPSPENLERLASALSTANAVDQECGPANQGATSGASRCFASELGTLNIIRSIPLFGELDRDALPCAVQDVAVRVCGLSHLQAMTRASGRPEDLAVLARLGA